MFATRPTSIPGYRFGLSRVLPTAPVWSTAVVLLAATVLLALPMWAHAAPNGVAVAPNMAVDLAAEVGAQFAISPNRGKKARTPIPAPAPAPQRPKAAGLAKADPAPAPFVHTQVMFMVAREVNFDMARVAAGTEVVLHLESPPDDVSQLYLAEDDPLVAGISLEPDVGGGTRIRVFLREHAVRSATQVLKRPFRVVLDLVHDLPAVPVRIPDEFDTALKQAKQAARYRSPFAIAAPVDMSRLPLALSVVVRGPISGDGSELFSTAYTAFARNKRQKARDGFNQFLKQYPDSHLAASAAYLLGNMAFEAAWEKGGARAKVAQQLDGLMRRYPRSPNAPLSLIRMAEVLAAESKWVDAMPLATAVLADYQDGPFVRAAALLAGQIALGQNHVRTALKHFKAVRERGAEDAYGVAATLGLGETMVRMGRYPRAAALYEEAIRHNPGRAKGDVHQLKLMGRALMEAGRFTDARQVFLMLYNIFPSSYPAGVALSQVADTFRGEGLWELAERRYLDVIKSYPRSEGSLTARMSLADLYMDRQRSYGRVTMGLVIGGKLGRASEDELLAEALKLYNQVVELAPSDALSEEAMYKTALLYQQMGDDEAALAKNRELMTRNPKTYWKIPVRELAEEVYARRATVLLAEGKAAEAVKLFRDYEPYLFLPTFRGWRPHYPLALASEAVGLNKQAMRHFLSLLGSRAPDDYRARALYRLGSLYLRTGQPGEALKRLLHHKKRFPNGPNQELVLRRIAEAHVALGDDDLAVSAYRHYLKLVDGLPRRDGRLALAQVRKRQGQIGKAVALHRFVLKADDADGGTVAPVPSSARVALAMADLEYDRGRKKAAKAAYDDALERGLSGDHRRWAELRRGQAEMAVKRKVSGREILAKLADEGQNSLIGNMAREVGRSPE